MIRAPGVSTAGAIAEAPASLIDLYPTLTDLCRVPVRQKSPQALPLAGRSLRACLERPAEAELDAAVLTAVEARGPATQGGAHFSLRTRDWRYIRYQNGQEELYDHRSDGEEITNRATDASAADDLTALRTRLDGIVSVKVS